MKTAHSAISLGMTSAPGDVELRQRSWHVAQLKPGGFQTARAHLARQNFLILCPMERRPAPRKGKASAPLIRPLFPGYLFVSAGEDPADWRRINATRGVSRLLAGTGGEPASLSTDFISALDARTDSEGVLRPPEALAPGTEVQILSGAFSNWLGRVERCLPNQRYLLLLEMMGRTVRADIASSDLSPT